MKKINVKPIIISNSEKISYMLSEDAIIKNNCFNWIRHEMSSEAEILFQYPEYLPINEKKLYIDYNNIKNLGDAWDYIRRFKKLNNIDYLEIKNIHSILSKNTNIKGGAYRLSDFYIEKLQMNAPRFQTIIYKMNDIEFDLKNNSVDFLTRALNFHYNLIELQPFDDFNKRTARITMNCFLLNNNLTPILFNKKSDKKDYMDALLKCAQGNKKEYYKYMYNCMLRTQESILKILNFRTY